MKATFALPSGQTDDAGTGMWWTRAIGEMTTTNALVSVIVPTYNRAHLIESTLDSVFDQTYRPIELLVVDDGSRDETADVVEKWAVRRCAEGGAFSLRYLRQDNAGPSAARNTGLRECSGQFIQFLDSDDILHREKLARQVAAIERHQVDFCVCNYKSIVMHPSEPGPVFDFYSRPHSIECFPWHYPMDTPAPLFCRDVVMRNGPWDEGLNAGEDFEYNFRIVAGGAKGIWLNEVLLYVRKHDGVERRQATPLATRYRSMYLGLSKMEMEAIERGVCSRKLLDNLGLRAHQYYRHTRAEGSVAEAQVFRRYARPRLLWMTKVALCAKRVFPRPVVSLCVLAKGLLRSKSQ